MKTRLWLNSEHILTNGWVEIEVVEYILKMEKIEAGDGVSCWPVTMAGAQLGIIGV